VSAGSDFRALLALTALAVMPRTIHAELQVGLLFSDGMVLQRDQIVPVWGTASPGSEISVGFRGQSAAAHADAQGRWQVELAATSAGGPYDMEISTGGEDLVVHDVLVGDVWVCSGQSNMEWTVADSMNAAAEIALASDSAIRHFKVPRSWSAEPVDTLAGGQWQTADPESVGSFTAVGYFFAREIRREIEVPIGLINSSWGGSRIEPWMSAAALAMDDADVRQVLEDEKAYEQEIRTMLEASVGGVPDSDRGFVDGEPIWADPDLDDSSWDEIPVPSAWEAVGYPGMDGIAWYRTSFHLTAEEAEKGIRLGLGTIDDSDISWVNGHEVGRTENAWNQARLYEVPPKALRSGGNILVVRVEDPQGGGGIQGDPGLLFIESDGNRRSLVGMWKFAVGYFTVNLEDHKRALPTLLYNHMVYPLLRFPIKGVLWYQGESNADYAEDAVAYRGLFVDLIEDWRRGWRAEDLPFLWVQLASFMSPPMVPADSAWATLRESQSAALALPHTAQVITLDVGEALDVHPTNKQAVGHRLALAALGTTYGRDVVYSGPTYKEHRVEAGEVWITFEHVGSGLVARDAAGGGVRGFAVAGAKGDFVWARAKIEGDRVVVWHPEVPQPVAVRYAWADNPEGANLYNREGLPAGPFRTDSW
jgi:sialate O-acetylesterase